MLSSSRGACCVGHRGQWVAVRLECQAAIERTLQQWDNIAAGPRPTPPRAARPPCPAESSGRFAPPSRSTRAIGTRCGRRLSSLRDTPGRRHARNPRTSSGSQFGCPVGAAPAGGGHCGVGSARIRPMCFSPGEDMSPASRQLHRSLLVSTMLTTICMGNGRR